MLVHGAGFRDKTMGFINYWGRIPAYLSKNGIKIYYGNTDAWGSIEVNASILKKQIEKIIAKENVEKVTIIAHSRGGLEARYMINKLGMDNAVASLTTISTPHHGVMLMNIACLMPDKLYKLISFLVNTWFKMVGDKQPDFFKSSRQLSKLYSRDFNKNNPNAENIYYQSYAAQMKYPFSDITFLFLNILIKITDGENDGLCPVESAKWGDFKGVVTTSGIFGISHSGIIDLYRVPYKGISIPEWYLNIIKDLFLKGY
jgi:triacylglycerol lipase